MIFNRIILLSLTFLLIASGCREDKVSPLEFGRLQGKVLASEGLIPMAEVTIKTAPVSSTVLTGTDGTFTINDLETGTYAVRAEKTGYETSSESVSIQANGLTEVTIFLDIATSQNHTPEAPAEPSPTPGLTNQPVNLDLSWSAFDADETDELVYTLTIYNEQPASEQIFADLTEPLVSLTGLAFGAKYSWQVTVSDGESDPVFGPVWTFTTIPFPSGHQFWFTKIVNGKMVIFSSDAAGNGIALTDPAYNNWSPQANLKSKKIAFISDRDQEDYLYIMNLDGSNQERLTLDVPIKGFNRFDLDFCWSPTGTQLLYMNYNRLYKITTTNSTGQAFEFTVAPEGQSFASCDWTYQNGVHSIVARTSYPYPKTYDGEIYLIDRSGNFLDTLVFNRPGKIGGGRFSPDGMHILYTYDVAEYEAPNGRQLESHILQLDLTSKEIIDISSVGATSGMLDLDPRYSPEGSKVIFTVKSNSVTATETNVYTMNIDGSDRQLLFAGAQMPDWQQ